MLMPRANPAQSLSGRAQASVEKTTANRRSLNREIEAAMVKDERPTNPIAKHLSEMKRRVPITPLVPPTWGGLPRGVAEGSHPHHPRLHPKLKR